MSENSVRAKANWNLGRWARTWEDELETILALQHLELSNFSDRDDLQKRLVVFVKGINTNLAQKSVELEEETSQMAEEVEAQLLFHANKVSQQIWDTGQEL